MPILKQHADLMLPRGATFFCRVFWHRACCRRAVVARLTLCVWAACLSTGWLTTLHAQEPVLPETESQPPASASPAGADQASPDPAAAAATFFEKHIRPVLARHCYSCHSDRRKSREGGLALDSREQLLLGGDRGPAIVPGDVAASPLLQALRYDDSDFQMPPDAPLSPNVVKHFEQWIRIGAPWPKSSAVTAEADWQDPSDPIAGRSHWAFQPLDPGALAHQNEPQTPHAAGRVIDDYVQQKLADHDQQQAEPADRATLLRRTSFQLIGLPPDPQELADFLSDDRPRAFARQVDRLLASRHFGERWGRHWLDLARYADSNGLDENFLFREAWRYRNRIIELMNEDVPYNRFLEEQIAGDLLPFDSVEQRDQQRTSAGFLVIGPKVLLGNDPNERIMDVADEQIDTIGRAVLGMTLGCARCHDHKFDPVPTKDYYALAGIFTSTSVMQRRYMLGQQRVMEQLIGLGADGDQQNTDYENYWRERPAVQARQKHVQSVLGLLEKNDEAALAAFAKKHPDAVAPNVVDTKLATAQRLEAQRGLLKQIQESLKNPPPIPPRAMIPVDKDQPADEAVRLAGRFDRKGDAVDRGFLQVLSRQPQQIADTDSGRLQLARWLTDTKSGAGNLTARVLANRIWYHLIGRGIVRTVDNFGRTGETPSHPELLDYLAARLIASGWSVKSLIRDIVLSETFRQSSRFESRAYAIDPDNRLLWKAHRRRLDPESLRDAMLHVAGTLDRAPLDSTVSYLGDQATSVGDNKNRRRTDYQNRSVYLPVIRNDLPELFQAFDFADPHSATGLRPQTLVPMQGLFLMNDDGVMQAAAATVERVTKEEPQSDGRRKIQLLYQRVLNDEPSAEEVEQMLNFIRGETDALPAEQHPQAVKTAWTAACQALFASSRFQTLE